MPAFTRTNCDDHFAVHLNDMTKVSSVSLLLCIASLGLVEAFTDLYGLPRLPVTPPGLVGCVQRSRPQGAAFVLQETALKESQYPAHTLETPIDHFHGKGRYAPHSNGTFPQRYWMDDHFFAPGSPIFILLGGETNGENRLPFLESGILPILAEPTAGLSIVLEHRYYGKSKMPFANLSTDSLRFLSTEQSLADVAFFIQHVELPGHGRINKESSVIVYGGSYAGGQAAFLRRLYPRLVYGSIASSAVVTAIYDYWRYFEPIRQHGPPACIATVVESIELLDSLLSLNNTKVTHTVKTAFGLPNVTDDRDFMNILNVPLSLACARNWDKEVGSSGFMRFCDRLATPRREGDRRLQDLALQVPKVEGGVLSLSNYAAYIQGNVAVLCETSDQDVCFATHDRKVLQRTGKDQEWRLWAYQTCTEWAYWMPGAPPGHPSLISRLITTEWIQEICQIAFPPGVSTSMPQKPMLNQINQWGNFSIEEDRIAFIDGSYDPWISATTHAVAAPSREDTRLRPFKLIKRGVHHFDENGTPGRQEPRAIRQIHAQEIAFVKSWLRDWESGVR